MSEINAPLDLEAIIIWLRDYYNIHAIMINPLDGEVDYNYKVSDQNGTVVTVKISRPNTDKSVIDFQYSILEHIAKSVIAISVPSSIHTTDGKPYINLGNDQYLRVQEWIEGDMIGQANPHSQQTIGSWGSAAGKITKALQGYDHLLAHKSYKWNPSEIPSLKSKLEYISNKKQITTVHYFFDLFEKRVSPNLASLRKSINHNDLHELNVISTYLDDVALVSGVIDFGDAMYTETINELAIACAYACMGKSDPLKVAAQMVHAYHKEYPLQELELTVLFPLIAARLLITVLNAAENLQIEPDNTYLQVSANPAWELLYKLQKIHPQLATYRFRSACGLEPCNKRMDYNQWLQSNSTNFHQVIDIKDKALHHLDLAVDSLEFGNNENFEDVDLFAKHVRRTLEDHNTDFGIGGYLETRPIYTTDSYQVNGDYGPKWRTVHLGLDIWTPSDEKVYAPLDGVVHSIHNNEGDRNYGPTLILKHEVSDELTFYTLYGHLALRSLSLLRIGDQVQSSQHICWVGDAPVNGNWPPHLHFQVILDMMEWQHDFPGVCHYEEVDTYRSICPDPALFLDIPIQLRLNKTEATAAILAYREEHLGKSLSISYAQPLHIVRGSMQYLYDHTGRKYLDTVNNVAHVGHEHPRVVKAAQKQIAILNTNTRYLHPQINTFAERLLQTLPDSLSVVHFVNSGSEANELALRMAKVYTGQRDVIAMEVGYHGSTGACVDVSSYKFDGKGGKGAPKYTHVAPIPDTYRGIYRDKNTGQQYADHIQQLITNIHKEGRELAAFIGESILSCGGQIVLPDGYLKQVQEYVHEAGGLMIVDEVQTGLGRIGAHYWAYDLYDMVPDIVTIGKPLGNGHPLAAVVTTAAIADAFNNGMEYFSTFGGNPVSSAIGAEILQIIEDDNLQQHALEMGSYIIKALKKLQGRHHIIGDVRGHGLFLGIELILDQETLTPADKEATYLVNRMRELGFLMSTDGPYHNVIKIKPPMCITKENIDLLIQYLTSVLNENIMLKRLSTSQ